MGWLVKCNNRAARHSIRSIDKFLLQKRFYSVCWKPECVAVMQWSNVYRCGNPAIYIHEQHRKVHFTPVPIEPSWRSSVYQDFHNKLCLAYIPGQKSMDLQSSKLAIDLSSYACRIGSYSATPSQPPRCPVGTRGEGLGVGWIVILCTCKLISRLQRGWDCHFDECTQRVPEEESPV